MTSAEPTISLKIVVAGSPHAGKSCFKELLKRALVPRAGKKGLYPYVIDASPDGEGAWFQEAASRDRAAADLYRARQKRAFTEEFAQRIGLSVQHCSVPLELIDIGGRIDAKQFTISAGATHIVILYRAEDDLAAWRAFAEQLHLTVIAELRSELDAPVDEVHAEGPPLTGVVHHLERGVLERPHPAVDALADHILTHFNHLPEGQVTDSDRPYTIERQGSTLKLAFGASAPGDLIVQDIIKGLDELDNAGQLAGGGLIALDGACSVAGMAVIAHRLSHRFAAVAVLDPKLPAYIVVISHDPRWTPGERLMVS